MFFSLFSTGGGEEGEEEDGGGGGQPRGSQLQRSSGFQPLCFSPGKVIGFGTPPPPSLLFVTSVVEPDLQRSASVWEPGSASASNKYQEPHQSDTKLDQDPHQFADEMPKWMRCSLFQVFEPFF